MKKIIVLGFVSISFYCKAQDKVVLTTGDTLIGKVSKVDSEHLRIMKADGTSKLILSSMIKKSDDPEIYKIPLMNKKAKEKIIAGCLINTVSVVLFVQTIRINNDPIYDYYASGQQDRKEKMILASAVGGLCLIIGTANIMSGVHIQNKEGLSAGFTPNGVGLVYKW